MSNCRCRFQTFQVQNLSKNLEISLMISNDRKHKCSFSKPRINESCQTSGLNHVEFRNLNQILQRRFYQLCSPVFARQLCQSSKTTANIGKKPKTFKGKVFAVKDLSRVSKVIEISGSFVIDVYEKAIFDSMDSQDLRQILHRFNFKNSYVSFCNTSFTASEMERLCHDQINRACFEKCQFGLSSAIDWSSNVKMFFFDGEMPDNWEKLLFNWNPPNLETCVLKSAEIVDMKSLADFVKNQRPHFTLLIPIHESQLFLDYFAPQLRKDQTPVISSSVGHLKYFKPK